MNQEITCPHCGYELGDSWEEYPGEEDLGLYYCEDCGKGYYATRNIEITYTTTPAKYEKCKKCGQSDVVIEKYTSSIGCYAGLCVNCGAIEKQDMLARWLREGSRNK